MKPAMTSSATIKETTKPTESTMISSEVMVKLILSNEYADAANKVGIARKKENSAATSLEHPISIAPIIVAAERDVPGIIARHCIRPIKSMVL